MKMKPLELVIWIGVFVCSILACFWIRDNLFATSYNYGSLSSNYSSSLKFNIMSNTFVLTQETGSTVYSYSTTFSSAYQVCSDFDADAKEYMMTLNGECFAMSTIEKGYAKLELNFTFLDPYGEELCTDTLYIQLEFYLGSTNLYVYTADGTESITYWNYLFDTCGFELRVYEVGEKTTTSADASATAITVVYSATSDVA